MVGILSYVNLCSVDSELLQQGAIFIPIDEDLGGIRLLIIEAARLADSLRESERLDVERDLRIKSEDVLVQRAQRGEGR